MGVQRVGPPGPPSEKREKEIPDEKRFKKSMTVEQISEIDADQRKKKRERAQGPETSSEEEDKQQPASHTLSPYQPEFLLSARDTDLFGRTTPTLGDEQTQAGSPQPSIIPSPPTFDDEETAPLPSSQSFWQDTEWEVTTPQPTYTTMQPTPQSQPVVEQKEVVVKPTSKGTAGKEGKGKKPTKAEVPTTTTTKKGQAPSPPPTAKAAKPAKTEEPSTFPFLVKGGKEGQAPKEKEVTPAKGKVTQEAPPPAPPAPKKAQAETPPTKQVKQEEKVVPERPTYGVEEKVPYQERPFKKASDQEQKEAKYGGLQGLAQSFAPAMIIDTGEKGEKEGKKKETKTEAISGGENVRTFTPDVAATASNAATAAASYISPQTQALFSQMVGTIIIMQMPPGISQTQVILNSPAFANSVFKDAVITLQRFSTAPDSFNIRLTGSTDAVNLFNANIPNLMTAFQKGKFKFRVGRLEASHEPAARPVFRRKEGTGGMESDTGEKKKKR